MYVPLQAATPETTYGGKAHQLSIALNAGLPVPPGFAVAHYEARAALRTPEALAHVIPQLGGMIAVRSSGIGEDAATASFAGQHATVLGVCNAAGLRDALQMVLDSAKTAAAIEYRRKLGLDLNPRMAVVLQKLVRSDCAGVLFTRNPVDGSDERVIEVSWGLGDAVVQGLVVPDQIRMARGGKVLSSTVGHKDVAIAWSLQGGTEERPVERARIAQPCLGERELAQLEALAARCEAVFGGTQDLEFAFEGGELYLLQRRAITRA